MHIQYIYCPKCGGILRKSKECFMLNERFSPILPKCSECGRMYQVEITDDLKIKLQEATL